MSHPSELDAVLTFLTALAVTAVLTPVTMRIAVAIGAIDEPRERGLSDRATPRLGALDDRFELPPVVKLAGQALAAVIVVHFGVAVKAITLPFIGTLQFPNAGVTNAGPILTVIGL